MVKLIRSAAAESDLIDILDYGLVRWDRDDALAFVFSFDEEYALLEQYPEIGRRRAELGEGIRSWPHHNYLLYYRIDGDRLDVLRILHAVADVSAAQFIQ